MSERKGAFALNKLTFSMLLATAFIVFESPLSAQSFDAPWQCSVIKTGPPDICLECVVQLCIQPDETSSVVKWRVTNIGSSQVQLCAIDALLGWWMAPAFSGQVPGLPAVLDGGEAFDLGLTSYDQLKSFGSLSPKVTFVDTMTCR